MTPSELMSLSTDEYHFLVNGLEWLRTKEREAMK